MCEKGILPEEGQRERTLPTESEWKREEEALRKSGITDTVALGTLLHNMEAGICLLTVGSRITLTYASPGFYRMLGLEDGSWRLPRELSEVGIHPEDEADYRRRLKEWGKAGGAFTHSHRISGDGRTWIWRRVRTICLDAKAEDGSLMLEISTDISDLIDKETLLRESYERLRVAFGQTPHLLWEVNIRSRTFSRYDANIQSCMTDTVTENFPDSLIENGVVHPDSASRFRRFGEEILRGNEGGSGNFIMKNQQNSRYEWVSLSYRMTCDRSGIPVKAIGIQEKLPNVSGGFSQQYPRRPLPEAVRHSLLGRIQVDLTDDRLMENWTEGMDRIGWTRGCSLSEQLAGQEQRGMLRGDREQLRKRFRRENLLEAYRRGEYWSSREYRRVDAGGNICWMRDTVNLTRDPDTGHILMKACFSDSEKLHQWEKLSEEKAEHTEAGGLYTRQAARGIVEGLMHKGCEYHCALALIYIAGGIDQLKEREPGQRLQDFIGTALALALGSDCVLGDYREDMILSYFPMAGSRFDIKKRMEDAFAYVRTSLRDMEGMDRLRLVAGVVIAYPEEAQYEDMVMQSAYLCNLWQNSAMDTVVFPEDNNDWMWKNLGGNDQGFVKTSVASRQDHSEAEKEAALACMSGMLTAGSMDASARSVLGCMGRYYMADRAYILIFSEDRTTVTLLYEWLSGGKVSIRQTALGLQVSKIPVLVQCMKRKTTVFVEKPPQNPQQGGETWKFFAYPLETEKRPVGFLCVENPRIHMRDDGLLDLVVPYLLKEPTRFRGRSGENAGQGAADRLCSLPNLRAFRRTGYDLTSDSYSSMGAAVLDVPNFSDINSREGFAYGRSMLLKILDTIESIFGKEYLFRLWDAEFAVLLPNTVLDVFNTRCIRMKTKLQRQYPGQIRIGYTWSDGIFSARSLVHEAQAIMRSETVPALSDEKLMLTADVLLANVSPVFIKRYIPYFQPKVDMRTGILAGAEALARGIDENGDIVSPSRFIETLEKSGGIRELDLYMLESVFRQLDIWRRKGLPLVKISVNISRRTLFGPTALASILAIQSRYPEVRSDLVELEITETAGDIETATMAEVINRFREFDIGFELDDFGSRYANISIFSNIRFNTIKLDRSLVKDLPGNDISKMMIENIAGICRNFRMECVAEGVETKQQKDVLLKAGCTLGQGYYYSRPVSARKFEERYLNMADKGTEQIKSMGGGNLG